MKITERINSLAIGEILKGAGKGGNIDFEKFQPFVRRSENHTNLKISYFNSKIILVEVENGISDEELGKAIEELKRKHLEDLEMDFNDFNRYNCGNKFDI